MLLQFEYIVLSHKQFYLYTTLLTLFDHRLRYEMDEILQFFHFLPSSPFPFLSSSPPPPFSLLPVCLPSPLPDKLDAVGVFRKRKRLHSEVDEEEEGDSGELSLTEYLRRKQEESSQAASGGRKKKRVGRLRAVA